MLSAASDLATDRRADIDATVKRMQASASEAEATFQKLNRAGAESWASLNDALVASRAAFDRANQAAWDAFPIPVPEQRDNGVLARHAAVYEFTFDTERTSRPCSHKADFLIALANVRFRGQSGHNADTSECYLYFHLVHLMS